MVSDPATAVLPFARRVPVARLLGVSLLFAAAGTTSILIFSHAVQQMESRYLDFHHEMPALTQILLATGRILGMPGLGLMWIACILLPVVAGRRGASASNSALSRRPIVWACWACALLLVLLWILILAHDQNTDSLYHLITNR